MKKIKVKVGDIVRIKNWKDMENEYGVDSDGDINLDPCYSTDMIQFCGNLFVVTVKDKLKSMDSEYLLTGINGNHQSVVKYIFTEEMFKVVSGDTDNTRSKKVKKFQKKIQSGLFKKNIKDIL